MLNIVVIDKGRGYFKTRLNFVSMLSFAGQYNTNETKLSDSPAFH